MLFAAAAAAVGVAAVVAVSSYCYFPLLLPFLLRLLLPLRYLLMLLPLLATKRLWFVALMAMELTTDS